MTALGWELYALAVVCLVGFLSTIGSPRYVFLGAWGALLVAALAVWITAAVTS